MTLINEIRLNVAAGSGLIFVCENLSESDILLERGKNVRGGKPKEPRVISRKDYGAYERRKEIWDDSEYRSGPPKGLEMDSCYSTVDGSYIGPFEDSSRKMIDKYKMTKVQAGRSGGPVAVIGYVDNFQGKGPKWVGWSHRAAVPFGIGDKLFVEKEYADMNNPKLKFTQGGKVPIKTMDQAKQAAINFASYIS